VDKENPGERKEGGKEGSHCCNGVFGGEIGGGGEDRSMKWGWDGDFGGGGWYYLQNW